MPPRPQRLVRRRPLSERIQTMLNPLDLYLWLSEEIQTFDWDSKTFGTRFGLAANFIFFVARANLGGREDIDDVFSDNSSNGWVTYLVSQAHIPSCAIQCCLLTQKTGQLPRLDPPPHLHRERILDHDEHAPLQALRDQCRIHGPLNAICAPCQSRLLSRVFDPPPIRPGPPQIRIS